SKTLRVHDVPRGIMWPRHSYWPPWQLSHFTRFGFIGCWVVVPSSALRPGTPAWQTLPITNIVSRTSAGAGQGTTHSSPKKPAVNSRLTPVAVQQQTAASPSKHPTAIAARGKYHAAGSAVSGAADSTTDAALQPGAPRRPNRARTNANTSRLIRLTASAAGAT